MDSWEEAARVARCAAYYDKNETIQSLIAEREELTRQRDEYRARVESWEEDYRQRNLHPHKQAQH